MELEDGLTRRRLLGVAGGVGALATAKAVDNVFLGYELLGTNLHEQDLAGLFASSLTTGVRRTERNGVGVALWNGELRLTEGLDGPVVERYRWRDLDRSALRAIDDEYGLDGLLAESIPVLDALHEDRVGFEFADHETFFERVADADHNEAAIELLRGFSGADASTVEAFVGAPPSDPREVVSSLVGAFRERSHYDVARYAAGSVQFNVIGNAYDLRAAFRGDTGFEALAEGGVGMFCDEFARRSAEAIHAAPVAEQSPPLFAGLVIDHRHKHVFTTLATVVRGDDGPEIHATFVDYTHTTLYDDLGLVGVLGQGLKAYNRRHRADRLWWGARA